MSLVLEKPNFSAGAWADGGNIVTPDVNKVYQGHVVEKPKAEIVNWIENRQDRAIKYLFEQGVGGWDDVSEYPVNAYVKHNGTIYKSKVQNDNKDPSTNPLIWEIAFADYNAYKDLEEEVRNIRETDGFVSHYVKISAPVMDAVARGVGYASKASAAKGLFFKSNNNPEIKGGGNYSFDGTYAKADDVIRRADLDVLLKAATQMRVGDLYLTTNAGNPSQTLGYGTWEQYAQGRAIVGVSTYSSNNPAWTKNVGGTAGAYEHVLTIDQMPRHQFGLGITDENEGGASAPYGKQKTPTGREVTDNRGGVLNEENLSQPLGSNEPHNNTQPSIAVFIWRRVS